MKKTIMKIAFAIIFMALPEVCSAQGLLINSTGMLPWKPVPYNNQSSSQNNSQNNNTGLSNDALLNEWEKRKNQNNNQNNNQNRQQFEQMPLSGGLLIDETYYIDENGNKIKYVLDAPASSSSSSTRRSSSSSNNKCRRCGGHGGCPTCGATGKVLNTMYGGHTYSRCGTCGGSKNCPSCGR